MIEGIMKGLIQGVTLVEDSSGSVGRTFAKQIGSVACSLGKKVILFTTEDKAEAYESLELNNFNPQISIEELESLSLYNASKGYDLLVIDSFSVFLFDKTEMQIVDIMKSMKELAKNGKCFVLTHESDMFTPRINSYIRSMADSIAIIRTEFVGNKINEMLQLSKIKGAKPMTKLLKITLEKNGIQIDTRELIG